MRTHAMNIMGDGALCSTINVNADDMMTFYKEVYRNSAESFFSQEGHCIFSR